MRVPDAMVPPVSVARSIRDEASLRTSDKRSSQKAGRLKGTQIRRTDSESATLFGHFPW
jgi:hypothetical protein